MSQQPTRSSTRSTREKAPPRATQYDAKRKLIRKNQQRQEDLGVLRDAIQTQQNAETQAQATAVAAVAVFGDPNDGNESTEESRVQALLKDEARARFLQVELVKRGHRNIDTLDLDELEYRWKNREPSPLLIGNAVHGSYKSVTFGSGTTPFAPKHNAARDTTHKRRIPDSEDSDDGEERPLTYQRVSTAPGPLNRKPVYPPRPPTASRPQYSQNIKSTPTEPRKRTTPQPTASNSPQSPRAALLNHQRAWLSSRKASSLHSRGGVPAREQPLPTTSRASAGHKPRHAPSNSNSQHSHQHVDSDSNRQDSDADENTKDKPKRRIRKRSKPCITEFEGLRKELAWRASYDARAYITASGLFSRRTQLDIWIEEAWLHANQVHNRGRPPLPILPAERTWIRNLLPTLRGAIKDELKTHIPMAYGLDEDNSPEENAQQVEKLLPHGFHQWTEPEDELPRPFRHPFLARAYQLAFFRHRDDLGVLYNVYFNPARSETVAFICAIIHFLLAQWETGSRIRSTLRGSTPREYYETHLESLRRFERNNPNRYRNTMARLHDTAFKRSGLAVYNDNSNLNRALPEEQFGEDSDTEYQREYNPKDFQSAALPEDDYDFEPDQSADAGPSTRANRSPGVNSLKEQDYDELDKDPEEDYEAESDRYPPGEDIGTGDGAQMEFDEGERPKYYYFRAPGGKGWMKVPYEQ